MPKTAIVYRSPHHGNTKKLLDAIVQAHPEVELFHAGDAGFDPADYDAIGFASGVYMGKLHRKVRKAIGSLHSDGRKAFALFTCGDSAGGKYGERMMEALRQKGFEACGYFWCVGLDTVGPLVLFGGVNKGRPNADDARDAVHFFEGLNL